MEALNVDPDRKTLNGVVDKLPLPFQSYWTSHAARLKSIQQWNTRLNTMAGEGANLSFNTMKEIGNFIFCHLRKDGGISADKLQSPCVN